MTADTERDRAPAGANVTPTTPAQILGAAPVVVRGWLLQANGRTWFRWWCPREKYWHVRGWRIDDDGLRQAPKCMRGAGRIRLSPIGDATPAIIAAIDDDRAPPGEADPGPRVTPEMAHERCRREFEAITSQVGSHGDEFLDSTIYRIEFELTVMKIWRYLHGLTKGCVRRKDIFRVYDAVRWGRMTIDEAATKVLGLVLS